MWLCGMEARRWFPQSVVTGLSFVHYRNLNWGAPFSLKPPTRRSQAERLRLDRSTRKQLNTQGCNNYKPVSAPFLMTIEPNIFHWEVILDTFEGADQLAAWLCDPSTWTYFASDRLSATKMLNWVHFGVHRSCSPNMREARIRKTRGPFIREHDVTNGWS